MLTAPPSEPDVPTAVGTWWRRVIGYAIGRRIDARRVIEALRRAIALRNPAPGCVFHSDRGAPYAAEKHRALLTKHGLVGSMSRCGDPYDHPQAESFMKTLKVEDACMMDDETYDEVASGLSRFLEEVYNRRRLHSALGYLRPVEFENRNARTPGKAAA